MSKRLLPLFICIVLLFSTSFTSIAESPQDSISKNKIKFQQLSDKVINMNSKISDLNNQIDKLSGEIKKIEQDINKVSVEIENTVSKRDRLNDEVDRNQALADRRLRAMYKSTSTGNYLSIILTSKSLSDFFTRLDAINKITSLDKKVLKDLKEKKENLNKSIEVLSLKSSKLQTLNETNNANLQQITAKKTEMESLISLYNEEKKAAALLIEENEEKLIARSASVINSPSPTISALRNAINTLKSLLPQLSTPSVKNKSKYSIEAGTKKLEFLIAESTKLSRGNDDDNTSYKATFSMVATAYTAPDYALTAMGLKPIRDPSGLSTIAVDPKVIPLGTKVYIPGYGYAIASDTGGAIKGNKIDIFLNTVEECFQWGRRTVTLYVVAYPGEW